MLLILVIAAVILLLLLMLYNALNVKGILKKILIIGECLTAVIVISLLLLTAVSRLSYKEQAGEDALMGGTLMNSLTFEGEAEAYYLVKRSYLMEADLLAIPKETCKMSVWVPVTGYVFLFERSGSAIYFSEENRIQIGEKQGYLADGIYRLVPDFWLIAFEAFLYGVFFITAGNFLIAVYVFLQKKNKVRKPADRVGEE